MGFHVQVGTNGIDLPEGFEYLDSIDRYVLPLESMDATVHDGLRIFPRSHHAIILDRLTRLREAGKSVTVSTVVTRQNIGGLDDVGRFLEAYRLAGAPLHAWHLYKFLPQGRGGLPNADRLCVDDAEYHRACDAVKQTGLGFHVYKRSDMYRSRSVGFFQAPLSAAKKSVGLRGNSPGLSGGRSTDAWEGKWNANCSVEPCRERGDDPDGASACDLRWVRCPPF